MPKKTPSTEAPNVHADQPVVASKPERKPRARAVPKAPAAEDAPPAPGPKGKLGLVLNMLLHPEGATIEALSEATGWQLHSVRGAISGSLKKKLGLTVTSEKTEAGRIYRIQKGASA